MNRSNFRPAAETDDNTLSRSLR